MTAALTHLRSRIGLVAALCAVMLGSGASTLSLASASAATHHHSRHHTASCRANHRDLDRDGSDRHCPDDRDGSTV